MKKIEENAATFDKNVADDIINICFKKIEDHHGLNKHEKIFKNYRTYKKLVQKENETVMEYLGRREEIEMKLSNEGIKMDDTLLAIDLMDNSKLTQQEEHCPNKG